jgi:hypothetical protein
VNKLLAELVPPDVVIKTLAVPTLPAGAVQVAVVPLTTVKLIQAAPPTVMPVAPVRSVPVMEMDVPPKVVPTFGVIDVIEGELTDGALTELLKLSPLVVPT